MPHYPAHLVPPISAHPGSQPCAPHQLPAGYVSRGGMFEGPTMVGGPQACAFIDRRQPPLALRPIGPFGPVIGNVPQNIQRREVHFAPLSTGLGSAIGRKIKDWWKKAFGAFGEDVRYENVPRGQAAVTCPPSPGASPQGMTPKGGIFDGSTLTVSPGQWLEAAPNYPCFFDEPRPQLVPEDQGPLRRLPNPGATPQQIPFVRPLAQAGPLRKGRPYEQQPRALKNARDYMRPRQVSQDNLMAPRPIGGFGAGPDGIGGW